jgi:hypothetical protein
MWILISLVLLAIILIWSSLEIALCQAKTELNQISTTKFIKSLTIQFCVSLVVIALVSVCLLGVDQLYESKKTADGFVEYVYTFLLMSLIAIAVYVTMKIYGGYKNRILDN